MRKTFGSMPTSLPEGMLTAVRYPVLALVDKQTGDHRLLSGEGGGSRDLPLTIQTKMFSGGGHDNAVPSGALYEVEIDTDTGIVSGRGFLLDDEVGQKTAYWIKTKAMNKNSVDLADIKVLWVEDFDAGEWWIEFTKWNIAATTFVATPAFAEAHAELMASFVESITDPMEELVASFEPGQIEYNLPQAPVADEVTADGAPKPAFEHFYEPEADVPTKIVVTEDGRVFGHLGVWGTCHEGVEGQCKIIPRPTDGYSAFNAPGVLTDRGMVHTGPIFAFGGHRPAMGRPDLAAAYGGIENAWADVRVIEGKLGPWLSGRVRPGVPDETIYAVRASRISGHWVGGQLKAIVSVNVPGFPVPAGEREPELVASAAFSLDDSGVSELWASFPDCLTPAAPAPATTGTFSTPNGSVTFVMPESFDWTAFASSHNWNQTTTTGTTTTTVAPVDPNQGKFDLDQQGQQQSLLALLLEDEDE